MRRASILLLVALAACTRVAGSSTASGGNPWTQHGRFVFGETQDAKSLNPMLATSASIGDLSMFLYSYAVRYDEHAHPVPDAVREIPTVENGDVSKDGLTLTYKLRKNITWHDGQPLTCRDLRFTWQAVMNPHNNGITTDGYKDIADIDCRDPYVAVVHMKRIYAPFLQQLWGVNGNAPILPEHLLAKYNDDKGSFNTAPYQSAPVGSGPFQFVRWDRGSEVVMKAYDKYFLGRPKLNEVVFKYVPDNNTLVNEVRTHEVDMAVRVTASTWPAMQGIAGTVTGAQPDYVFSHVDFNLRRPLFAGDVELRRALEMAIDRPQLLQKISHGLGDLTDTAQPSNGLSWAYTKDTAHYPFDLPGARARLDRDGWRVGPGGIRVKNGRRLAFTLGVPNESDTGLLYEVQIQRMWHDAGADVSIKNQPSAQFFDNTSAGVLQGGHYDVAIFSWSGAADPDDSAIYSGHNLPPRGQNALFWQDPVATAAMDDELSTVDRARRLKDFIIEQQRFASDVPSIVLSYARQPFVYNTDLHGYRPSPVISSFWNPWEYSL